MTDQPLTPDGTNRFLAEKLMGWKRVTAYWLRPDGKPCPSVPNWYGDAGLVHREIIPAMVALDWELATMCDRDGTLAIYSPRGKIFPRFSAQHSDFSSACCVAAVEALKGKS